MPTIIRLQRLLAGAILLFFGGLHYTSKKFALPTPSQRSNDSPAVSRYQPNPPSCRRTCHDKRRNKIIFTLDNPAGLRDRKKIISHLTDLAGYLCAIVEFPPPSRMLAASHNRKQPTHHNVTWDDFWNFTFISDNFKQEQSSLVTLPQLARKQWSNSKYGDRYNKQKDWYHVVTKFPDDVFQDFQVVETFSFSNQQHIANRPGGFIWEIRTPWYAEARTNLRNGLEQRRRRIQTADNETADNETAISKNIARDWTMLPPDPLYYPNGPKCKYTQESVPARLQADVDQVIQAIENKNGLEARSASSSPSSAIGYLHVRRGDSQTLGVSCNTSLTKMEAYLNCTFSKSKVSNATTTLLFMSDEPNQEYRTSMARLVENMGVKFIDLDEMVWNVLHKKERNNLKAGQETKHEYLANDNYYIFQVMDVLRIQFGSFYLQQRRQFSCNECDKAIVSSSSKRNNQQVSV